MGLEEINSSAFAHNELKSLTLPESINHLGIQVFINNKLESVYIPSGIAKTPKLDQWTFDGNPIGTYTIDAYDYECPVAGAAPWGASGASTVIWKENIIDIPVADTTVFTYNGSEQTYNIANNLGYTVTGNKEINAGTYTVTASLKDKVRTSWTDGTTDDITFTFVVNKSVVTEKDLSSLVTAPVNSAVPQSDFSNQGQYTGTITWSGSPTTFAPSTVYTATITLSETSNYTFVGVGENTFSHVGATTVENSVDSNVVSLTFPATSSNGDDITYYTLKFDTNGGNSIPSEKYLSSKTATLTKEPIKDGDRKSVV